jgi:hypothetical protein
MKSPRGYLLILALVFGSVFLTVFGGLSMFVLSENRLQTHIEESSEAFALAEAGLEYYRWFLAHFPTDIQNGTGQPGPYVLTYEDPEAGVAGSATLSIVGNTACNQTTSIDITSVGAPADSPSVTRTLRARYARPSVGTYSYILNDSVWAGSDRVILGPYHSNGGVRMDGTANSPVTSSLSSWNCNSNYGCTPTQATAPGVVGSGPNQNLWDWPVPQVDFSGISADFGTLKTLAQASGIYYPRYSTTNGQGEPAYWRGYHLIFNANGTVTVRRVSATTQLSVSHVNPSDTLGTDRALISNEADYETRTIPVTCGLIFVEDNVWVEGTIPQKVTLVAANVVNANIAPTAYLVGNIQYGAQDGTDGFTLIAEHNVLIAPNAPTNMTLNGIFIAQGGAFGRNYYKNSSGTCHTTYEPRTSLTILGTTVSNRRTGTKWNLSSSCAGGSYAGFGTRVDSYDRRIAFDPPPFTPVVSTDYEFISWREE